MQRRVVQVAVVAAAAAILVFALPLALVLAQLLQSGEREEMRLLAMRTAAQIDPGRPGVVPARTGADADDRLAVYDRSGRRVAGVGPASADSSVRVALAGDVATADAPGVFVVSVPVRGADGIVGAIRAATSDRHVRQRTRTAVVAMAILAGAALGAAVLVARRQARLLSGRLEDLAAAAQALGDGDFSVRLPPSGVAEVDRVAGALTTTAGRLGRLVERERALAEDASHQLRTPLTGLRLSLETGLTGSEQDLRESVGTALAAAARLDQTVEDLLRLRRQAVAAEGRPVVPLTADDLLSGVRTRWRDTFGAAGRELRVRAGSGAPATTASAAAVGQVLDVLLDNALRHGGGAVEVHARDAGGALAVDVSDEGPGVQISRAELFRRGASTNGSGIGLALAEELVRAEGGRLALSSAVPAVFTLVLPEAADPVVDSADDQPSSGTVRK